MAETSVEVLEMAKALYPFKATIPKTLSFKEGDLFLIYQQSTKERNWWQVIDSQAQVGYVPSNYVASATVAAEKALGFVTGCVKTLREEGNLGAERQDLLGRLLTRKQQLKELAEESEPQVSQITPEPKPIMKKEEKPEKPKPSPNKPSLSKMQVAASQQPPPAAPAPQTEEPKNQGPTLQDLRRLSLASSEARSLNTSRKNSTQPGCEHITEETVYQIVEQVRRHTELSHELSRVAVSVVLTSLEPLLPPQPALCGLQRLLSQPAHSAPPARLLDATHDAQRLRVIFSELTSCKEDAQQRSWMLHEDEDVIVDYIKELTSILMNADALISRHVVCSNQYSDVLHLVQYYQMETRWRIRQPLLQALGVLCSLDRSIPGIFLTSVLPMELARDMRANPEDMSRLNHSALLLAMVCSSGEAMPVTHWEHLGEEFIEFCLDLIEGPPQGDLEDQIPDLFITLLLSYNLQFDSKAPQDNVLVQTLATRSSAKAFTEKILLLLNREDDPARIFDHEPAPPHSVLKLFVDLFSCAASAALFYTNDVKVLIDIIVRQLADLSPGDPRRQLYLELCRVVMRNSSYSEHHHRRDDLLKAFTRIFCEESESSARDQQVVREISNEFPQHFKS